MKRLFIVLFFCFSLHQIHAQKLYKPTCTTLAPIKGNYVEGIDTTPGRSVANPYLVWDNEEPISVKFLGTASPAIRAMVIRYAKEWEQFAAIKFQFVDDNTPSTNMRIKLGDGKGHNSFVGVNCNEISQTEQTMNLDTMSFLDFNYYIAEMKKKGIKPNMEDLKAMLKVSSPQWDYREIRKTVLHEFGHALGLLHEQSYPGAIKWNKDTVYKYYQRTQGWDRAKTESQVFLASNQFFTNGTQYDAKSIMHYPIESWQTTNGFSIPANFDLSVGDKALIAALYPANRSLDTAAVPRVMINNFKLLQVVNDSAKGGIRIYPSFDLKTNAKLGTVYVVAMLVDENGYYVKDDNDYYNWGGYVAVYPKLTLLPNSKASYNGLKKNLELFLPYSEIPATAGKKVKFRFSVVIQDVQNNQWVYVMNHFTKTFFSLGK